MKILCNSSINPQSTDYENVTFRTDMGYPNPAILIGCILGCNSLITTIFFNRLLDL